jgi:hypothetical protein
MQILLPERVKSLFPPTLIHAKGSEEEKPKMPDKGGSNRAVIGFIVGGFLGYWASGGNLLAALAVGVIGAFMAARFFS